MGTSTDLPSNSKSYTVSGILPLSSVVRISEKYDVADLFDSMVSILSDIYPSSLTRWLNRTRAIPPGYRATRDDPIYALNIARKLNLHSLLPGWLNRTRAIPPVTAHKALGEGLRISKALVKGKALAKGASKALADFPTHPGGIKIVSKRGWA
jgi:hypothetical protein